MRALGSSDVRWLAIRRRAGYRLCVEPAGNRLSRLAVLSRSALGVGLRVAQVEFFSSIFSAGVLYSVYSGFGALVARSAVPSPHLGGL